MAIRLRPRGPWVTKGAPPWLHPVGSVGLPFTRARGPPPRRAAALPTGAATRAAHAKAIKVARPRIEPGQSPASIASAQAAAQPGIGTPVDSMRLVRRA